MRIFKSTFQNGIFNWQLPSADRGCILYKIPFFHNNRHIGNGLAGIQVMELWIVFRWKCCQPRRHEINGWAECDPLFCHPIKGFVVQGLSTHSPQGWASRLRSTETLWESPWEQVAQNPRPVAATRGLSSPFPQIIMNRHATPGVTCHVVGKPLDWKAAKGRLLFWNNQFFPNILLCTAYLNTLHKKRLCGLLSLSIQKFQATFAESRFYLRPAIRQMSPRHPASKK